MNEHESIAQRYIDVWNETDPVKRRLIVEEVYTSDATYTDPLAAVAGHEAIDQMIGAVQQQFGGLRFTLGPVDGHHDIARFTWELGEDQLVIGFDVIVLADGKIKHVHGFLDKVPA
ncbi:nuclear transport factor 2 family protein [Kibdelosporangium persicum]|uniref:Polyketide cyclase n=1 Tax=Kibdelosporangium persicum TaxID=2698649 RepID=A0ABX2FFA2_9PSEU|nr:nuclear transport factor 2 family protein [Kibdelosporangium persicum]NRN69572.1 Polyketide cyclase [Kibdelosporangium persicum]